MEGSRRRSFSSPPFSFFLCVLRTVRGVKKRQITISLRSPPVRRAARACDGRDFERSHNVCQTPGKLLREEKNNSVIIIPSALWINPVMHSDVAENCNTSDGYRLVVEPPRLFTKKPPESIHLPVCLLCFSDTLQFKENLCQVSDTLLLCGSDAAVDL